MGLLPNEQKDQLKVLGGMVAFGLAALYWMYPHATQVTENEALATRIDALERTNARAKAAASPEQLKQLKAEAARSRATLAALRRLVPTEREVPALLEQVSTAARRAGLEIGGVQPEPVLPGESFDTYRYKVTLVGGYHPIAAFMANAGSLPRIVAPVTFQLIPAVASAGRAQQLTAPTRTPRQALALQAQFTLQTYVMRTAPENTAGGSDPVGARIARTQGGEVVR